MTPMMLLALTSLPRQARNALAWKSCSACTSLADARACRPSLLLMTISFSSIFGAGNGEWGMGIGQNGFRTDRSGNGVGAYSPRGRCTQRLPRLSHSRFPIPDSQPSGRIDHDAAAATGGRGLREFVQ